MILALVQNEFLIKILFSFRVKTNFPSTLQTQTLLTADSHIKYALRVCHSLKSQENLI